jgi:hypothetical protein
VNIIINNIIIIIITFHEMVVINVFQAWINMRNAETKLERETWIASRASWQAARKHHRAGLLVPHLQNLNFVMFWPHATGAHPELYERWDANS